MRLTQYQVEILKSTAIDVFGPQSGLVLFGSRVDDSLRGGDIDLYITGFNRPAEQQLDAKLLFLVKVKRKIGEQRIDLVFAPQPNQTLLPIHRIAAHTGIAL
ncbi:MAG: nucleotidyltransferase domain-containing protein [Deltaproteobacteria bacterium]|nr:nucleotidyltransferase domain-containing protein [Deltaproteobacteria bacterium]